MADSTNKLELANYTEFKSALGGSSHKMFNRASNISLLVTIKTVLKIMQGQLMETKVVRLAVFVVAFSQLLFLTSCSSKLSSIDGQIAFKLPSHIQCETYGGSVGEVSTGEGKILGRIVMSGLGFSPLINGFKECKFGLKGEEINLDTDVLVIKFDIDETFGGKWILRPSEFRGGKISLNGGTAWSN